MFLHFGRLAHAQIEGRRFLILVFPCDGLGLVLERGFRVLEFVELLEQTIFLQFPPGAFFTERHGDVDAFPLVTEVAQFLAGVLMTAGGFDSRPEAE